MALPKAVGPQKVKGSEKTKPRKYKDYKYHSESYKTLSRLGVFGDNQ